jgi:GNAT superfamily N-acetyltransferase
MNDAIEAGSEYWIRVGAQTLAGMCVEVVEALGGRTADWDGDTVFDAESPNPFFNGVCLGKPLDASRASALTDRLEAFFCQREGGPWLLWSAWPTPDLRDLGYVLWGHPPIMVRPAGGSAPPLPAGLRIVEATDEAALREVERTIVLAYPMLGLEDRLPNCLFPPGLLGGRMRFWLGVVGDEPVGCAGATLGDRSTHVSFIATQPRHRGKGYGAALTWTATLAQPSLPAVLEASDDGRPVYERMGYREITRTSLWERPRDMANPVYSPYAPRS